MGQFVQATDIGAAWLTAYGKLRSSHRNITNLTVCIANPLQEDLGVRRVIEKHLVAHDGSGAQSTHTVANTIFPISLYRPSSSGAAKRYFSNVVSGQSARRSMKAGWGTYAGRLVAYPSRDGQSTNQLERVLTRLGRTPHFENAYEIPLAGPHDQPCGCSGALLHDDIRLDSRTRGGPCLAHISLSAPNRRLSMLALYRHHTYEDRAYGNFLGLARLLAFLAAESEHEVGELMVVTGHAEATWNVPEVDELYAEASQEVGDKAKIETHARPLGETYNDLKLPKATL